MARSKLRLFAVLFAAYGVTVFSRKSFTAALPAMFSPTFTMAEAGRLSSLFGIFYAGGRFLAGIVVDRVEPTFILALSLVATGVSNILFGQIADSSISQSFIWAANGLFQAFVWPSVSTVLVREFTKEERGRYWSLVSMSQNLAVSILTLAASSMLSSLGWQGVFLGIGSLAIGSAPIAYYLIRNFSSSPSEQNAKVLQPDPKTPKKVPEETTAELPRSRYLFNVTMLVLVSFCFNLLKASISDWGAVFLIKHASFSVQEANNAQFMFSIGGAIGTILSGEVSDYAGGRRDPVNKAFTCLTFLFAGLYWWGLGSSLLLWSAVSFCLGFAIFGPTTLLTLQVQESAQPRSSAQTIAGFVALCANFGAVCAGAPLSMLVESYGWGAYALTLFVTSFAGLACQLSVNERRSLPRLAATEQSGRRSTLRSATPRATKSKAE